MSLTKAGMMPFARYFCIFINVGLGEAAKSSILQSGGDSVKDVMSQN
ncbi:phage tail protein, partial [Escherichia coli]